MINLYKPPVIATLSFPRSYLVISKRFYYLSFVRKMYSEGTFACFPNMTEPHEQPYIYLLLNKEP